MLVSGAVLIDTHTHLDDARYNEDREAMIARAREAGIEAFVTIGCDLATSQAAVALAGPISRSSMPPSASIHMK